MTENNRPKSAKSERVLEAQAWQDHSSTSILFVESSPGNRGVNRRVTTSSVLFADIPARDASAEMHWCKRKAEARPWGVALRMLLYGSSESNSSNNSSKKGSATKVTANTALLSVVTDLSWGSVNAGKNP